MEWRLFTDGETPYVSTLEFHHDRDRAPHLEQDFHRPRLLKAARFVTDAAEDIGDGATVSDLGCGDGGLLSLVQDHAMISEAWGYEFTPANVAAWPERGVDGTQLDFVTDRDEVILGDIVVMTETLEHLADPHEFLRWIHASCEFPHYVVASSPAFENDVVHDGVHAWAWDQSGYAALFTQAGYRVERQELAGSFQVVLARL